MDDNKLASHDPDEFARLQTPKRSDGGQDDEYFEELERRLLEEADDSDHKNMPVSGKSVFEIERLKRKRAEKDQNLE